MSWNVTYVASNGGPRALVIIPLSLTGLVVGVLLAYWIRAVCNGHFLDIALIFTALSLGRDVFSDACCSDFLNCSQTVINILARCPLHDCRHGQECL